MKSQTMILPNGMVQEVIHWAVAGEIGFSAACIHEGEGEKLRHSNDPRAVTCVMCQGLEEFKVAREDLRHPKKGIG